MVNRIKYQRQDAIEKAMLLFWERGFNGTSMRNLQQAMDLRSGSIYSGFGDKETLFIEALRYYAANSIKQLALCKANNPSFLDALKAFFYQAMSNNGSRPSSMCLLVKSVSELTNEQAPLLLEAKKLLLEIEDAFVDILTEAKANKELGENKDPRRLARLLQMQLMGLRIYGCASFSGASFSSPPESATEGVISSQMEQMIQDVFHSLQ